MGQHVHGQVARQTSRSSAHCGRGRFLFTAAIGAVFVAGLGEATSTAQIVLEAQAGQPAAGAAVAQPAGGSQPQPSQQQPGQQAAQPDAAQKAGEEAKPQEKPAEGSAAGGESITRSNKPGFSPNPAELEIEPDEDGNLQFSFRGQPWPDVLGWLAGVSGLSLDWQEMPGDYLNLTTHRKYSIDEARDLINRHLLSRGFTLVVEGEVLHVVKLDKLDPSMVPHVAPLDLDAQLPSTVVKTIFDLPQDLPAEQAVEDVKQLLSAHGKNNVQALKATNRIFVIDSVANLLDVRRMITAERQELEGHTVPRTFVLRHARATDVVKTLQELLGLQGGGPQMPTDPQQMQQMMQQMQQQMQQQQQQQGGAAPKSPEKVHLVAVPRHNVILANAPPDKMEIIATTIEVLDVEMAEGESLLGQMHRMQRYRLVSLDPESLVATLQEIGNLDPRTRLQADKSTRSILAYATLADHVTIRALVDRLDGTGRSFEVIRLRRLPALEVAGTIRTLMGVEDEEENDSRRRTYYSFWYGGNQQEEGPKDSFRVEADIERNRLMLWANDAELAEINNFLVKMGEFPAAGTQTVRVMEASSSPETDALLQRLQQHWGGRNELIIQDNRPQPQQQPAAPAASTEQEEPAATEDRQTNVDRVRQATKSNVIRFAQLAEGSGSAEETPGGLSAGQVDAAGRSGQLPQGWPNADAAGEMPGRATAPQTPPVKITVTPDGRVLLQSDDPAALARLEDLILDLTPPPRDFKVFQVKHADAYWVAYDLKDFFAEEIDEKDTGPRLPYYYYGYNSGSTDDDAASRLSQQRKLTFVANTDTNAIIVRGATDEQLRTIEELIQVFDRPMQEENVSTRKTKIVRIRYSQAQIIADAIKEAYRDLLSSKDTAFQNQNQQQQDREGREELVRIYDYGMSDDETKKPTPVKVSFEGALSIGVDKVSNTLIVSAQEELIDVIVNIAQELDRQAMPSATAQMHRVRNVDAAALHRMLSRTISDPWTGGKRPDAAGERGQQQPGQQPEQPNGQGQAQGQQQAGNGQGGNGQGGTAAVASQ